jgi:putative transposase
MTREVDPTALTAAEWRDLLPHLPAAKAGGRPRRQSGRDMLQAMFSLLRSGGAGRWLPHDRPPWKTVSHACRLWRVQGLGERVHRALPAAVRATGGRDPHPRTAIIERPSVNTTRVGGPRGDDGGTKVKGRHRHLRVEPQGLSIRAVVPPADLTDRDGAKRRLAPRPGQLPRLPQVWADSAYTGQVREWIQTTLGGPVESVKPWWTGLRWVGVAPGQDPPTIPRGFHVLPRRWVVESRHSEYPYPDTCLFSYDWPDRLVESRHRHAKVPASGRGRERELMSPHVLPPRP